MKVIKFGSILPTPDGLNFNDFEFWLEPGEQPTVADIMACVGAYLMNMAETLPDGQEEILNAGLYPVTPPDVKVH